MTFLLLRTTLAMLIAFGGGILGVVLGKVAPHRLNLLVYAAMGALLAVTAFDILQKHIAAAVETLDLAIEIVDRGDLFGK